MQTSKNTFNASVGGIIHAKTALELFAGTPSASETENTPSFLAEAYEHKTSRLLLKQFSRDILDNPIIIDVTKYAKENPKAKKIKKTDLSAGFNYDALLFKRSGQCLVKTQHHNNYTDGYTFKDVSQLFSTVKNARSLVIHALAGASGEEAYEWMTQVSSALNSIHRDVESLLRVVAPWGERCDVKAISFTH